MSTRTLMITLLISITHCVVGNIIGVSMIDTGILDYIFLPYTFIAGMSAFAGWDSLSYELELASFLVITLCLYPVVGLLRQRFSRKKK